MVTPVMVMVCDAMRAIPKSATLITGRLPACSLLMRMFPGLMSL